MFAKKAIALFLIVGQCLPPLSSAFATPLKSVDDIKEESRAYSSLPTSLHFKAQHGQTAAGTLLYARHEDKIYVLLGKRNDGPNTWCNFGGASEEAEGGEFLLAQTAARETEEESKGLYSFHPHLLKNKPYIDTHNGRLLYRMYWQKVSYLDLNIIRTRRGASSAQQEFIDFAWVEASLLYDAVNTQKPRLNPKSENSPQLYPEFFATLSTPAGRVFLQSLAKERKIQRFKKHMHPYVNRLYWVGEKTLVDDVNPAPRSQWPRVAVNAEQEALKVKERAKKNLANAKLPDPNEVERVSLDQPEDKSILARSVAAHIGMLIEMKKSFKGSPSKFGIQGNVPPQAQEVDESYSDMSLRIILGPDYKTKADFPKEENPQDAADDHNIKVFLDRYYRDQKPLEGKREVTILESDPLFMRRVLQNTRQHGGKPTFFHATNESFHGLFLFFTHLRQFMMASPLNGLVGLRGTDTYFKGIETMDDVIQKFGYRDYNHSKTSATSGPKARQNLVLCGNCTAFAGRATTFTSSSSLEYTLNDHTVSPPDLGATIQEALALSGFENPTDKYFASLFLQYVSSLHQHHANSVMLALHMDPTLLGKYTYAAFAGGNPYTQNVGTKEKREEKVLTLVAIFQGLLNEANRQRMAPEPFTHDEKRKHDLVPEARILVHPDLMYGNGIYVDATPRFPLKAAQKSEFEYLTHLTCMAMLGDWLSAGNKTMEGAFRTPPVAKALFHQVHRGLTGAFPEEKASSEGFFQLVRHGLVDAVQEYIQAYPTILQETAEAKDRLVVAALKSDTPEMLDFVFKHLKLDLSQEDVTKLFRIAKDSNLLRAVSFLQTYILEGNRGYATRFLPVLYFLLQPRTSLFFGEENALEKQVSLMPLLFAVPALPEWTKAKLLKQLFTQFPDEVSTELCTEYLFPQNVISPQDAITFLQGLLSSTPFGRLHNHGLSYQHLFLTFLNLSGPLTPEMALGLTEWKNPLCLDVLDYLSEQRGLLAHRYENGLTLLGLAQQGHLEGGSSEPLPSLQSLYKREGIDLGAASHSLFLELYGTDFKSRDRDSFFSDSQSKPRRLFYDEERQWAVAVAKASPEDYPTLVTTCPNKLLFSGFKKKLNTLQLSSVMQERQSAHDNSPWGQKAYRFFSMKRNGPVQQEKEMVDHSFLRGLLSVMPNASLHFNVLDELDKARDQFPEDNPMRVMQEDDTPKDMPALLADMPDSIGTLEEFLATLKESQVWRAGIVEYVQSLPEYEAIIVPAFQKRQERLAEKKRIWLDTLSQLVKEKDKVQVYKHVQSMPYLSEEEISIVTKQLAPFYSPESHQRYAYPWEAYTKSRADKWMPEVYQLLQAGKEKENAVSQFIDLLPPSALRLALHLFLTKEGVPYLPKVLQKAYASPRDFAETHEFRIEHEDPISKLPETYRHPFPFMLRSEHPAELVRTFLPFLDSQEAPKLIKHLEKDQLWKVMKQNSLREVESLVTLIPWLFQHSTPGKDFFLYSIQNMSKPALRKLMQQSHGKLKETEMEDRFLPYFVHLMMDGQNADIIREALEADPTLLDIHSLDGMGMEDFLTWYASPAIAKVVRDFQRNRQAKTTLLQ